MRPEPKWKKFARPEELVEIQRLTPIAEAGRVAASERAAIVRRIMSRSVYRVKIKGETYATQ